MLSYMLPVEEKSPPRNLNLNLNLNGNVNGNGNSSDDSSSKLLNSERAGVLKSTTVIESQRPQFVVKVSREENNVDNKLEDAGGTGGGSILISNSTNDDSKKIKMSKIGNSKNVTLKR